MGLQKEVTL